MSLNKFTSTSKGMDLKLKIGCEELEAKNITVDNLAIQSITADVVNTDLINYGGSVLSINDLEANQIDCARVQATQFINAPFYSSLGIPVPLVNNFIQTQGVQNVAVNDTAIETSLVPALVVGRADGFIPANTIETGTSIKLTCWGRISSAAGGVLDLKLYLKDGTFLACATGPQSVGGSPNNDLFKIEISIVQDATLFRLNGTFTVFYTAPNRESLTYEFVALGFNPIKEVNNFVRLTGTWDVAANNSVITVNQYQVEVLKPQPILH
jgi:hypothetical protein